MKKNIVTNIMAVAVLVGTLAACSKTAKETPQAAETPAIEAAPVADSTTTTVSAPQFSVDNAFRQQLAGVFNAYLGVKDALVTSDAAKVKAASPAVGQALKKVDMKLLSGAAHHDWMSYLPAMESSAKAIEATADIGAQRQAFHTLSDNLYKSIKAYGLSGTTAYYDYCPMAFNNAGASWLSNNAEIRNPYFGDEMLTCGSVKETLQ